MKKMFISSICFYKKKFNKYGFSKKYGNQDNKLKKMAKI